MFKRLQAIIDRLSSHITLWQALGIGSVFSMGVIGAWIGAATRWINAYGPYGWLIAGFVAAILAGAVLLLLALIRNAYIRGEAVRKWKEQVDTINPLDKQFTNKRIKIQDLVDPVSGAISNKTFIDCQLIGPANLFPRNHLNFNGGSFNYCDMIAPEHNAPVYNVVPMDNITMLRGSIEKCCIFVAPNMVPTFLAMGARFLTAIPAPPPTGIASMPLTTELASIPLPR